MERHRSSTEAKIPAETGRSLSGLLHRLGIIDKYKEKPYGVEVDDFTWEKMGHSERAVLHAWARAYPSTRQSVQLKLIQDRSTGETTYNPNLSLEERAQAKEFMDQAAFEIVIVDADPNMD